MYNTLFNARDRRTTEKAAQAIAKPLWAGVPDYVCSLGGNGLAGRGSVHANVFFKQLLRGVSLRSDGARGRGAAVAIFLLWTQSS